VGVPCTTRPLLFFWPVALSPSSLPRWHVSSRRHLGVTWRSWPCRFGPLWPSPPFSRGGGGGSNCPRKPKQAPSNENRWTPKKTQARGGRYWVSNGGCGGRKRCTVEFQARDGWWCQQRASFKRGLYRTLLEFRAEFNIITIYGFVPDYVVS